MDVHAANGLPFVKDALDRARLGVHVGLPMLTRPAALLELLAAIRETVSRMAFGIKHWTLLSRRPRILVFGCTNYNIGRTPRELQKAGARVAVLCHRNDSLAATQYTDWLFTSPDRNEPHLTTRRLLHLAVVLAIVRPDIVVPGDERSLYVMIDLEKRLGRITRKLLLGAATALRRSLPSHAHMAAATERNTNQRLAERLRIPCPVAIALDSLADLETFVQEVGLPIVIKNERSKAGEGVSICGTIEEVRRGWEERHRGRPPRRALVQKFTPRAA